jgi:endonuclease/exonuclease/phosphatase family metal-dependent hydrolase
VDKQQQTSARAISWLLWIACSYLVVVTVLWSLMTYVGEQWWLTTVLLFAPRWVVALPLLVLVPFAVWRDRRALIPLVLTGIVVVVLFMGFNIPLNKHSGVDKGKVKTLRIFSYNILGGMVNAEEFSAFLQQSAVDIVALQECPEEFKLPLPRGWYSAKKRGLAIMSRYPIRSVTPVEVLQPQDQWPGTYLLQTVIQVPGGDVAFCSLHLPSPRFGLQAVLDKTTLLRPSRKGLLEKELFGRQFVAVKLHNYIKDLKLPVIIAGDFNTTVDSSLYRQFWSGYNNAFSATGWGYGWTQRLSVRGLPLRVRIDHILTGTGLTPLSSAIGPDLGSDHLPLIADIGRVADR